MQNNAFVFLETKLDKFCQSYTRKGGVENTVKEYVKENLKSSRKKKQNVED